jgi:hypothetical protein
MQWAEQTGPATAQGVAAILASRPQAQQGFRSCLSLMRWGKTYGDDRLEAACRRVLAIQATSYKSIEAILSHRAGPAPLCPRPPRAPPPLRHPHSRGADYFH